MWKKFKNLLNEKNLKKFKNKFIKELLITRKNDGYLKIDNQKK